MSEVELPKDKTQVFFAAFGFGDNLESVTRIAGIEPTQAWIKGEPFGKNGAIHNHSRWVLSSRSLGSDPFEKQLDELLNLLEAHKPSICALGEQFETGILVAAYHYSSCNLGFHVSAESCARLAKLGLSIDFDMYVLAEN